MMPGAVGLGSAVWLYYRKDGAATGFKPCRTVSGRNFSYRSVLSCDGGGFADGDTQFVAGGGGQCVVAFAPLLNPSNTPRPPFCRACANSVSSGVVS